MGLFYSVEDRNTPDWEVLGAPLDVYGCLQFRHPRGVVPRYLLVSYFPLFSKNKKKNGKTFIGRQMGRKTKPGTSTLWGKGDTSAGGLLRGDDMMLAETGVNWGVTQEGTRTSRR